MDNQETIETVINLLKKKLVILGTSTRLYDGGTLQIWTDITEIREKEREVEESQRQVREAEEKISNAINSMPHGITMWDKNMKLLMINDFAKKTWKKGNINLKVGSSYEDYMRQSKNNKYLIFNNSIDEKEYYKNAIDKRKKFKGVLTLGDLTKAISNNVSIENLVKDSYNKNSIFYEDPISDQEIIEAVNEYKF